MIVQQHTRKLWILAILGALLGGISIYYAGTADRGNRGNQVLDPSPRMGQAESEPQSPIAGVAAPSDPQSPIAGVAAPTTGASRDPQPVQEPKSLLKQPCDETRPPQSRKFWQPQTDILTVIDCLQLPHDALLDYLDIPADSPIRRSDSGKLEGVRNEVIAKYQDLHSEYASALMKRAFEIERERSQYPNSLLGLKRTEPTIDDNVFGIVYIGSDPIYVYRNENPGVFDAHHRIMGLPRELRNLMISRLGAR